MQRRLSTWPKKQGSKQFLWMIPRRDNFMEAKEITTEIQNIVDQIIQKYKPMKSILFGSAGRGEYDKVNDLDFLIIKKNVPSYGHARMRELDELIDRNIAADMLVYRPDEVEDRIKLGDPFFVQRQTHKERIIHSKT
jgi:predicted nucleotidyltransferase